MKKETKQVYVNSEIGKLKRLLVHSPDSGLGKVVPSKAQDWLFEDIVHLDTIRKKEYDFYTKLLLYFLDSSKIKGRLAKIDHPNAKRNFYKPGNKDFFRSDKVVELQWLLSEILTKHEIKLKLVASVCAIEGCPHETELLLYHLAPDLLAKVFITGSLDNDTMIFPPIPNFIFTRDIGIVIKEHILLNKPAKKARNRETLLAKYIFYYHRFFAGTRNNIIEISDSAFHFLLPKDNEDKKVTLEGGDVMVIHKDHLLIGVSERTTMEAAQQVIQILFKKNIVNKITVIKIPKKRDYMHIDTIFTQVKKNVWVMLGAFSNRTINKEDGDSIQSVLEESKKEDKIKIIQFNKKNINKSVYFENLEKLLTHISIVDFKCKGKIKFIFSGNNEFPFDTREQWTDSCNLLALREGLVLGYDRNDKTIEAFRQNGFHIIHAHDLIEQFENGKVVPDAIKDTLILMPSAELSRARGGFHCMSMPLLRDNI